MTAEKARFVALFDCSPADPPAWVKATCQQAGLFFVDNDFVTGVCLPVDGGRTIYSPDAAE